MENPLATTLLITTIGMSLLFLSLVLFYGIISLLAAATRERPAITADRIDEAEEQEDAPEGRALQAAAIAIALARAEAEGRAGRVAGSAVLASGERDVTPWWSLHHQHRLAHKRGPRRPGQ